MRPIHIAVRLFNSCICGECSLFKVICCLATLLVLSALLRNTSTTILTSYQGIRLEVKDIDKVAVNTFVIENANGNYYVAFEIPKESSVFRRIKQGVNLYKPAETARKTTNEVVTETYRRLGDPVPALTVSGKAVQFFPTAKPEYPLSVYPDAYNINNKHICDIGKNLTFVVLVHSATGHFSRRISIRETWANKQLFKNHHIRVVFLLGQPEKESTQVLIEHENSLYGDVVQGNFLDSYHNLTHKAVLGVRWVVEHCRNTRAVVKVDDDVFLNVFQLLHDMETKYRNTSRSIHCGIRHINTSSIQRTGKWKVDEGYFRNMSFYPFAYCNGFFALMTADMFPALYEAAKQTPFFWIDDVYLFGLLRERVGDVAIRGLGNLNLFEKRAVECFENRERKCDLLVATSRSEGVMDMLWANAVQHYKDLAKKYSKDEYFGSLL